MLIRTLRLRMTSRDEFTLMNFNEELVSQLRAFSTNASEFDKCVSNDTIKLLILVRNKPIINQIQLASDEEIKVEINWVGEFKMDISVGDEFRIAEHVLKVSEVSMEEKELESVCKKSFTVKTISPILIKEPFPEPSNLLKKYVILNVLSDDILENSWVSRHELRGKKLDGGSYLINGVIRINFERDVDVSLFSVLGIGLLTHLGFGSVIIAYE